MRWASRGRVRKRWNGAAAQAADCGCAGGVVVVVAAILLLPRSTPSEPLDRLHVAVLPFVNPSGKADDEYFGDGIAEEIMYALRGVDGVRVVAKTSSFGFRKSNENLRNVGRKLSAGSVLQGSVQRDGDRVRVTAQLVDANSGSKEWSDSYDQPLSAIFEVQNRIATAVAERLVGASASETPLTAASTADIEAYLLFLRANHRMRQRGAENLTQAIDLFQQAIARDGNFGRAYAGLAEAYMLQPQYAGGSEKAAHGPALAALERAEALGAGDGHTLGVRAFVHFRAREWQAAHDDFERAIAASPNDSDVLQWYSQFLASIGWIERAKRAARDAVVDDPLSPVANQRAGVVSLWINDPDAADDHFTVSSEVGIQGSGLPEAWIAFLLNEGKLGAARAALIETQGSRGQSIAWIDPVFAAMTQQGSKQAALDALASDFAAGSLGVPMYVGALFFVGDIDGLYAAMDKVVASGEPFDVELFFSRMGRPFRKDARFTPLMMRLGLVDFWDKAGWPDLCAREGARVVCR